MEFFYVSFQNKKIGFNNSILEKNKNINGNAFIPPSVVLSGQFVCSYSLSHYKREQGGYLC